MSAKIMAFTPYVKNYKELIEKNLLLPINAADNIEGYYTGFDYDYIFNNALSHTTYIPYFRYFDKDQFLRRQYFDVIRALEQKEMWVMSEMLDNYIDEDQSDFYEFLKKLDTILDYSDGTKGIHTFDINNFEFNEEGFCTNYYSAYYDTFDDLFQEVDCIEKKFHVNVLGLNLYEVDYIRITRENKQKAELLNQKTGEIKSFDANH